MNNEEIKIVKLLDEILLDNDLIKNLSKSCVSDFIKIDDSKFIRLFQSNLKLGVDFLTTNSDDNNTTFNPNHSNLKTYLFNKKGFLESSYNLEIEITYDENNIVEYTKKQPDLEAGSELEEIRNIALSNAQKYKEENEKSLLDWERKNKGIFGFFRKILKLNKSPLELDEPSEEFLQLRQLIDTILNKQLSLMNL